jgi:hypothetical protein
VAGIDERAIERTTDLNVVIRQDRAKAGAAWDAWQRVHRPQAGEGRLSAGGSVEEVADALRAYRNVGFEHPVLIFRTPWDLETIARLPELRAALAADEAVGA